MRVYFGHNTQAKKIRQLLVGTPSRDRSKNTLLLCVDSSFNLIKLFYPLCKIPDRFSETSETADQVNKTLESCVIQRGMTSLFVEIIV